MSLDIIPFEVFGFNYSCYVRLFNVSKEIRYKVCKYISDHKDDNYMDYAAGIGELNIMKWLKHIGVQITSHTFRKAAINNQFIVCEWLQHNNCHWQERDSCKVALNGHLGMLQWLHSNSHEITFLLPNYAAKRGHLDIIKWSKTIDIIHSVSSYQYAAKNGHIHILEWLYEEDKDETPTNVCISAIKGGKLETLQWLWYRGHSMDLAHCKCAAKLGHLQILQFMYEEGFTYITNLSRYAAKSGSIELIQWLRDQGADWDYLSCRNAARYGHLKLLQYLHNNGCKWNNDICFDVIAGFNHRFFRYKFIKSKICQDDIEQYLELLKWLKTRTISQYWTEKLVLEAIMSDITFVQWLHFNTELKISSWSHNVFQQIMDHGKLHVLQWVYDTESPMLKDKPLYPMIKY